MCVLRCAQSQLGFNTQWISSIESNRVREVAKKYSTQLLSLTKLTILIVAQTNKYIVYLNQTILKCTEYKGRCDIKGDSLERGPKYAVITLARTKQSEPKKKKTLHMAYVSSIVT